MNGLLNLVNGFGGGGAGLLDGLLTDEQKKGLATRRLGGFAQGLLAASAPSRMPVSMGQAMAQGMQQADASDDSMFKEMSVLAEMQKARNGGDRPSNVREWEYYKSLSPEEQQKYLTMKRAEKVLDLGGSFTRVNPVTGAPENNIPKTPTPQQSRDDQLNAEAEKGRALSALRENMQTSSKIDEILNNKSGLEGITGLSSILPNIPGGASANAQADLDTLKSRSAFGALQEMRTNSPTGGALGQVAVQELQMLKDAEASLQNAQSQPEFEKALKEYKLGLQAADKAVKDAYRNRYGADLPEPEAPAVAVPDGAVQMLRKNPALAAQFDAKYGPGASTRYLSGGLND